MLTPLVSWGDVVQWQWSMGDCLFIIGRRCLRHIYSATRHRYGISFSFKCPTWLCNQPQKKKYCWHQYWRHFCLFAIFGSMSCFYHFHIPDTSCHFNDLTPFESTCTGLLFQFSDNPFRLAFVACLSCFFIISLISAILPISTCMRRHWNYVVTTACIMFSDFSQTSTPDVSPV